MGGGRGRGCEYRLNANLDRGREYRPNAVRSVHTTEVKILPYRLTKHG